MTSWITFFHSLRGYGTIKSLHHQWLSIGYNSITPAPLRSIYEDSFVKIEISGLSQTLDSNRYAIVRIAYLITNKTTNVLYVGSNNNQSVTDENGNSCSGRSFSGINHSVFSNSSIGSYSVINPNATLSFAWRGDRDSNCSFTGQIYNTSFELVRYNQTTRSGDVVGVGFTGLKIAP
ncbi:hypothetical protein [Methylomagnum sp.]